MSKEELSWKERRDIAQKTMDKREFDGYQREDGMYEGFGYISPFTDFFIHYWLDNKNIPRLRSELSEEQLNLLNQNKDDEW
jgi:predicted ATP-binding protein involved in virulence